MILAAEIAGAVVCWVVFAIAATGRASLSARESANLNRVAIVSGIGGAGACALILMWFRQGPTP